MTNPYIFTTIDPLQRKVVLERDTFEGHIMIDHPEMKTRIPIIRQTIRDPDYIFTSTLRADRDIYIKLGGVPDFPELGSKAIVEFSSSTFGRIVSSWLVKEPSRSDISGGMRYEKPRRK